MFMKFSITTSSIDFHCCHSNHSIFIRHTRSDLVILIVYVDEILLTESDSIGLVETKEYPSHHFVTKNIGKLKYFLGIEVEHKKYSVLLSQKKYALDLLEETGLLGCKPSSTPMEANMDLWFDRNHILDDSGRYKKLIENLIYLTVTSLNVTFVVASLF